MRIRSGHKPEDWIECPPANPGSMPIRGQLVVGQSERTKALASAAKHRDKLRAAKLRDCTLEGFCRHPECVDTRRIEARRLLASDPNLTQREVGERLGGRSKSTIGDLIRESAA